jgi:carnitine O-acetyltransferase
MGFESENEAKASFDAVYTQPTPHAYIASMARNGYEIGEQARPYCTAAADLLRHCNRDAWPVQMLDVGCSYGMGAAFVRYGCSFDEMVAFFASRAPKERRAACEAMRSWLNVTPPVCDARVVGLDSSEPAIQFAVDAGLLDGGLARDFEQTDVSPNDEERAWFRSCNLLISTGAIGYVTERTFEAILPHLGRDHPADFGPVAVVTILRMFDVSPIREVFESHGLVFSPVPGVRLPQRRFADLQESRKVLSLLHEKGIDTREWEDRGRQYADLFVAAPEHQMQRLLEQMVTTQTELEGVSEGAGYIRR